VEEGDRAPQEGPSRARRDHRRASSGGAAEERVSWERLRALRVLKAVEDAGGSMPRKELNAKAIEFGYPSPSALGGWYEGKRQGSLRAEGDMAVLTEGGEKWLDEHRQELND
jgi:hypothetical protein